MRTTTLSARVPSISGSQAKNTACCTAYALLFLPSSHHTLILALPSARYPFLHTNTGIYSANSRTRNRRYVSSSPDPIRADLISVTPKPVSSMSLWAECAFKESRTYFLSFHNRPSSPSLFLICCPSADSSGATSQSFFPPLPQLSSTNTNFIQLGQYSNNTNHANSPKMP